MPIDSISAERSVAIASPVTSANNAMAGSATAAATARTATKSSTQRKVWSPLGAPVTRSST